LFFNQYCTCSFLTPELSPCASVSNEVVSILDSCLSFRSSSSIYIRVCECKRPQAFINCRNRNTAYPRSGPLADPTFRAFHSSTLPRLSLASLVTGTPEIPALGYRQSSSFPTSPTITQVHHDVLQQQQQQLGQLVQRRMFSFVSQIAFTFASAVLALANDASARSICPPSFAISLPGLSQQVCGRGGAGFW
jgi:hypothetical protein